MFDIIYTVSVDYHNYKFDNAGDALTFAKLAIYGGDVCVIMKLERKETADDEETTEETEA